MPVVKELFSFPVRPGIAKRRGFKTASCPFIKGPCDGGGNRNMARWPATELPLAPLFDPRVGQEGNGYIPCGVCSVHLPEGRDESGTDWAICSRRLLTFQPDTLAGPQGPLVRKIFALAGFRVGDQIRVWHEVPLKDANTSVDCRLDYVLRKMDGPPIIVEVMTASTSGGNKNKRTDIKNAFCNAVLYAAELRDELGQSPSVNSRQVWARMASQLIMKSEIANEWGGCTIWVVQDALADYIRKKTGLHLDALRSGDWRPSEVNVISVNMNDPNDLVLYAGPVRPKKPGDACWMDLLAAPGLPAADVLEVKLGDDAVMAVLEA